MLTLPPVLAPMSKLVGGPNQPRYGGAAGVHVTATNTGWEAAATDLKSALVVAGDHPDPKPEFEALAGAPNGATKANIPARWWADVFGAAKKVRKCPGVGLVLSDKLATAAAGATVTRTELLDERFPDYRRFMPKNPNEIGCSIRFDAALMAEMLKAMAALADPGESAAVVMEIRRPYNSQGSDKPFVLRLDHPAADVREVTAMVMPMGIKGDEKGDEQSTKFYGHATTFVERHAEIQAGNPQGLDWDVLRFDRDRLHDENQTLQAKTADLEAEAARLVTALAVAKTDNAGLLAELEKAARDAAGQSATIDFLRADADRCNEMLARFRDETQHGEELIGLWGRVGAAEQTTRDAVTESERLRAELDAVRADRDRLLADVEALRKAPAPAPRPAPAPVYHRPAAAPGVRRTLGELAALAKAGQ